MKTDEQINMEVSEAILNVMNKVQDEKQISFADYNNKKSQELFALQLDVFLRLGGKEATYLMLQRMIAQAQHQGETA
ncbi:MULTISPECIES: hypothetical protein [Burkholderiaceae]|jgi:hypothetical protein|uniref:Uncharacterized protein n=2 Tax=Burkholderiaceae TaxID=119060 RepID=A0A6J5JFP1_9BURK|nr:MULTISPECIES: hypothetical protein [Burkholderiaceae]ANJ73072.1 hypothetical protein A9Y76_11590 [Ralstonia insidiosa]KAB0601867.1 hypothetical protein F7R19_15315 [Cupriavidus pauculus]MBR8501602.1 hypothetical protein [Burkholderia cenocepacia]MCO8552984.1 hypothetical protein [Burkholderia multivorans]UAL00301.1 hypothetical protein K8O84_02675 [Cupriavidus pauculus]